MSKPKVGARDVDMVEVTLNNGYRMLAWILANLLFRYQKSNGQYVTVGLPQLSAIGGVPLEAKDKIVIGHPFHFLWKCTLGGHPCILRKISTDPDRNLKPGQESVIDRYNESLDTGQPVRGIFAIKGGTYNPSLLERTLQGQDYTVTIIGNDDLMEISPEQFDKEVRNASFMFANADYSYFFKFFNQDSTQFSLTAMGISVEEQKKSAKRLQELIRMTEMHLYLVGAEAMSTVRIVFPRAPGVQALYDGHSYVTRSFAARMAMSIVDDARRMRVIQDIFSGNLTEMILRVIMPPGYLSPISTGGMIKGNCTIVKDRQIDGDIATHVCNIKTEMRSEGYLYATMLEHEHTHLAVYDGQTDVTLAAGLPAHAKDSDIQRIINTIEEAMESGNLVPAYGKGAKAHNNDGLPNLERLSGALAKTVERWIAAGYDIRILQNLIYMWINGTEIRMTSEEKDNHDGLYYKKLWVPMTNASLMSVITWESAYYIGGFRNKDGFHNQVKEISFYDARIGYIMPGDRFLEVIRYHGGCDLDDQFKVLIVRVFASNTRKLRVYQGRTVPANSIIPDNENDARIMVLVMRSPNGQGEYSFQECNVKTLPIDAALRHDDYTVIDITEMPMPADLLESPRLVTMTGIPTSTQYSNQLMTRAFATDMVETHGRGDGTPDVGAACNPLIVNAAVSHTLPDPMIAPLEKIVDTLQQGHDKVSFDAIRKFCKNILNGLHGRQLDRYVGTTRIGSKRVLGKFRLFDGPYTKTHAKYLAAIETIHETLLNTSMQMRTVQPLVQQIRKEKFNEDLLKWAAGFYAKYDSLLASTNYLFSTDGVKDAFWKMNILHNKKMAMEDYVDEMVAEFDSIIDDSDRNNHILALWHYIVKEHPKTEKEHRQPYGISDRIICQPNGLGKKSLVDFLLNAMLAHPSFQPPPKKKA